MAIHTEFSHYIWWSPTVMLVYQRVYLLPKLKMSSYASPRIPASNQSTPTCVMGNPMCLAMGGSIGISPYLGGLWRNIFSEWMIWGYYISISLFIKGIDDTKVSAAMRNLNRTLDSPEGAQSATTLKVWSLFTWKTAAAFSNLWMVGG